jgi:hypothetical protein
LDSSPDDTALHEELLAGGREEFPVESFLLMRRTGLTIEECLDALGYKVSDLSFQHRAALAVEPNDEEQLKALLGYVP